MRSALIVVDMQNAFINPVRGRPVERAHEVVEEVNALVRDAHRDGSPVFFTRDVGPTELPPGDPDGETDLFSGLDARGVVVDKGPGKDGGFSGFVLTSVSDTVGGGPGDGGLSGLAEQLRRAQVDHVVVVGLAADVCVAATARDARRLGYVVTLPLDATAFVHAHPSGDEAGLADLAAAGVTIERAPSTV